MSINPKDIIIKSIKAEVVREFVRKHHYSGKVVNNNQLHFGCYLGAGMYKGQKVSLEARREKKDA